MKIKKYSKYLLPVAILSLLVIPLISDAAIVNCGLGNSGPEDCNFEKFIEIINVIIKYIIQLAISVFVVGIAIAGLRMILANGDPGKISEAKKMFKPLIVGFLWILFAFLVIRFIFSFARPEYRAGDLGIQDDIIRYTLTI